MIDSKNIVIRKSNKLIEARYSLTTNEQRFILSLLGNISPGDEDFQDYQVSIADFAEMFDLKASHSLYEKVEKAAEDLTSRKIKIEKGKNVKVMNWLSYVEYEKGEGVINLRFDKALKPYLLQLKTHFTQYNLSFVISFKGKYTFRLYEILRAESYKARNGVFETEIDVERIRELFEMKKDQYKIFADLKKRVLLPAFSEIDANSDISLVDAFFKKTGRRVTSIIFKCSLKNQNIQKNKAKSEVEKPFDGVISKYEKYGIVGAMVQAFINQGRTKEELENTLALFERDKKAGKIRENEQGYLSVLLVNNAGQLTQAEKEEKEAKVRQDAERKLKEQKTAKKEQIQMLEKEFLKIKKKEYLDTLSNSEKEELFVSLKAEHKDNGFIYGKIKDLESNYLSSQVASLVRSQEGYEDEKKEYIAKKS